MALLFHLTYKDAWEASRPAGEYAASSLAEEGCYDYTFSVELNNPDILRITERWESMAALEAHFQTPHMATFRAVMAENRPDNVTANFYEAVEVTPPAR